MTQTTAWLLLMAAGLLDVLWAVSMKDAQGYTRSAEVSSRCFYLRRSFSCSGAACKCCLLGTRGLDGCARGRHGADGPSAE
jgi:multidrug transporter EmrE-like cation transporter